MNKMISKLSLVLKIYITVALIIYGGFVGFLTKSCLILVTPSTVANSFSTHNIYWFSNG